MATDDPIIPIGLCQCGCGKPTPLATKTNRKLGHVKGEPVRYSPGHNGRWGKPMQDRFEAKIERLSDECWRWTGYVLWNGYGRFGIGRDHSGQKQVAYAHRVAYELYRGSIPTGMDIDHLCRRRNCVNPEHLEPVSHRENCLRGEAPNVQIHLSGYCKRGHKMDEQNTTIEIRSGKPKRRCKTCRNIQAQQWRARQGRARDVHDD